MIYELPKSDYARARPLFEGHRDHIVCMCGFDNPETRIVVDNPDHPSSALMVTWECWGYLAGNPHNQDFNRALHKALWDRKIVGKDIWGLLLTADQEDWLTQLPGIVEPSELVPFPRKQYTRSAIVPDWQLVVPDGYSIHRLDEALLKQHPDLAIPDDLQKLLKVADPLTEGFGFVALHDNAIVAHAMIDFIYDGEGDIGLATEEANRRKGLATATAAAATSFGLAHGLKSVHWDCHAQNKASIRTAEKLGYQFQYDYMMHYFDY